MMNHQLNFLHTYALMMLIILALGSFTIARHIHTRWLINHLALMESDALIKSIITLAGMAIVPWQHLFTLDLIHEGIGIFIGIIMGLLIIHLEVKMLRRINRSKLRNKKRKLPIEINYSQKSLQPVQALCLSSPKFISIKGLAHIRNRHRGFVEDLDIFNYSLLTILTVAIAEEFLFRGYLISIANHIENKLLTAFLILLSILLFSCSHLSSSWNEVKTKIPLTIVTTFEFMLTHTLISAIISHAMLNTYAYNQKQKWLNS